MHSSAPIRKVSVVIPVYNERECLPALLERTIAACRLLDRDHEIILVDDGSADDSAEIIQEAAERPDSRVVAVLLNRNYGQQTAVMAGMSQADLIETIVSESMIRQLVGFARKDAA